MLFKVMMLLSSWRNTLRWSLPYLRYLLKSSIWCYVEEYITAYTFIYTSKLFMFPGCQIQSFTSQWRKMVRHALMVSKCCKIFKVCLTFLKVLSHKFSCFLPWNSLIVKWWKSLITLIILSNWGILGKWNISTLLLRTKKLWTPVEYPIT